MIEKDVPYLYYCVAFSIPNSNLVGMTKRFWLRWRFLLIFKEKKTYDPQLEISCTNAGYSIPFWFSTPFEDKCITETFLPCFSKIQQRPVKMKSVSKVHMLSVTDEKAATYSVLHMLKQLRVTQNVVCSIFDEVREEPQTQGRFAILLDQIQLGIVVSTTHLTNFSNDHIDLLIEWVFQIGQCDLQKTNYENAILTVGRKWHLLFYLATTKSFIRFNIKQVHA
jgi:hypothetical protein